jgi:hypothetical protein
MTKAVKFITLFLLLSVVISCKTKNTTDYLKKVLNNLEKIESATYSAQSENWQHGDTAALHIFCHLYKEFNNPADTAIGASYVFFQCDIGNIYRLSNV